MTILGVDRIVFSKHADQRLTERCSPDLDQARDEIQEALEHGRVEPRARNIVYARSDDLARTYVLALYVRRRVAVVITVLTPLLDTLAA